MSYDYNAQQDKKALAKAIAIVKQQDTTITDGSEIIKRALKIKNHRKACSCDMCCNPRHSKHNKGLNRLTLQERKKLE